MRRRNTRISIKNGVFVLVPEFQRVFTGEKASGVLEMIYPESESFLLQSYSCSTFGACLVSHVYVCIYGVECFSRVVLTRVATVIWARWI